VALRYGFRASPIVKFGTWAGLLEQSFGAPYLSWVLLLGCLAGVVFWRPWRAQGWPGLSTRGGGIALVSALQIAVSLFTLSLGDPVEARYLYAVLPCVVVIVMWLCAHAASRKAVAVFCALCALQWISLHSVAFGAVSHVANQSAWLLRVQGDAHNFEDLARVVRATAVSGRFNIIGVEEPWLNANSASFFAAKNLLDSGVAGLYVSLGYAQTDVNVALRRIDGISARYVITLDGACQKNPPNFLNVVSLPILEELRHSDRFKAVPFPNGNGILVFERLEAQPDWTILSSIFPTGAATGADGTGGAWWIIHPSRRREGAMTRVEFKEPLQDHAVFSGKVESCDKRCEGVEVVLNISGPPGTNLTIRVPGPLQGKRIEADLGNSAGHRLTVDIRSLDPKRDNINYCWLTMTGIRVSAR
jgi:hypothetical protein